MSDKKPGMWQLLKNAKSMQDNMKQARDKLYGTRFTGESGPMTLAMTGDHMVQEDSVQCSDPSLSQTDTIMHIVTAFNNASMKIAQASQQQVQNITKDMGLDGVFDDDQK